VLPGLSFCFGYQDIHEGFVFHGVLLGAHLVKNKKVVMEEFVFFVQGVNHCSRGLTEEKTFQVFFVIQ
jgi:hypothetical protein